MKTFLFILLLTTVTGTSAQQKDEAAIRKILTAQTDAWNNGNIEEFMKSYWQNDSLMFIGKSGVTYSWEKTLDNYKTGYPDTSAMGKLNFDILQVNKLSDEYYFVVGKWFLKRTIGDIGGHFTLLFRKIKNTWVIVADHSN
ncbi:MAG: DUF4440 domain-containing protein [Chitinophagaceae bacterium]|nr:DUF4440 domain-containing protein [Chitinophagaceae bacterium]